MRYAYSDLGRQAAGTTVLVNLRGGGATNALLLSMADFLRYSTDKSFRYHGGRLHGNPMQIEIPSDDHWFVVLELGTYNTKARATVEVVPPGQDSPEPAGAFVDG